MAVIHARTPAEMREHILLSIGDCATHGVSIRRTEWFQHEGEWAATYAVDCPVDGKHWDVSYLTDPPPMDAGSDRAPHGYGPESSTLIDAGQWWWRFSWYARSVRETEQRAGSSMDVETAKRVLDWLHKAWESALEILKFIPAGQTRVPESAVWTEQGRQAYVEANDQFDRGVLEPLAARLLEVINMYRAKFGAPKLQPAS